MTMIRLILFFSFLFPGAQAVAQGAFMFEPTPAITRSTAPGTAPRPSVRTAVQPEDDEEVEEDYTPVRRQVRTSPEQGLRSPGRDAARGIRPAPRPAPAPRRETRRVQEEDSEETEARPPCRNCTPNRPPAVRITVRQNPPPVAIRSTPANMATPIWQPFARAFAACAPGCQPAQIGIHRAPNGRMSCHHSNRAIDVGAMICGGRVYRAIDNGRFGQMVSCMRNTFMRQGKSQNSVLYRQSHKRHLGPTVAHYDHVHISIGCHGGRFW